LNIERSGIQHSVRESRTNANARRNFEPGS